jgi:type III secretion protein O
MSKMLGQILAIKAFREARAALAVTRQRQVLQRAEARAEASQRQLEDYRSEAERRERALFDDLCSRVVRLSAIQDVHLEVEEMRLQERDHEKALEQARAERHRQAQTLVERRTEHSQSMQVKERFVELTRQATEEAAWEADRLEELELEEVAEIRSGRVLRERQQEEQETP